MRYDSDISFLQLCFLFLHLCFVLFERLFPPCLAASKCGPVFQRVVFSLSCLSKAFHWRHSFFSFWLHKGKGYYTMTALKDWDS